MPSVKGVSGSFGNGDARGLAALACAAAMFSLF